MPRRVSTGYKLVPFNIGRNNYKIELYTPSLLNLTYSDGEESVRDCAFKNMDFLVEARLHMEHYRGLEDRIKGITEGISKVQSLYLSGRFLKAVMFAECSLPTFYNLTSLAVGYNINDAWELLPKLLGSSPELKYLVLNDGLFGGDSCRGDQYKWHAPMSVPACLSQSLKVMKIRAFKGNSEEMKMVKYLLKKSKVLTTLMIESSMNTQDALKVSNEMLTFPRSIACKIVMIS